MKKQALRGTLVALSTILFATVGAAQAQGFGKKQHRRGGMGIAKLLMKFELSNEQKTSIANTLKSYKGRLEDSHNAVRNARKEMRKAAQDGELDETAVSKAAQKLGTAMGELAILRAKLRAETQAALTPEQQAQLKSERNQRKERRQQRRKERKEQRPNISQEWIDRHASS